MGSIFQKIRMRSNETISLKATMESYFLLHHIIISLTFLPQDIIGAKNINEFKRHRTNLCREESLLAVHEWSGCSAWLRQAL